MTVLSLFSGIGAFEKALDNLGVEYNLVNYCEIDKYASKSYAAIHNVSETMNLGDITQVDTSTLPKDIDLITYGFPCQDISLAGKQKGLFNADGSKTRSGLFFEALRINEATRPRVAIAENVKNLTGKKFKQQFEIVLKSLEEAGYNNYWQVLNAKDYGIPQNRERVFIVSVRKDIDNGLFQFPQGFPLKLRLKDMLDDIVDEKYYISTDKVNQFILNNPHIDTTKSVLGTCHERNDMSFATRDRVYNSEKESPTLTATMYKDPPKVLKVGNINPSGNGMNGVVVDSDGLARTITTEKGEGQKILVEEAKLIQVAQMYPNSGNPQAGRIYDANGISPAMDTCSGGNRMPKIIVKDGVVNNEPFIVASRGRNPENPSDRTTGIPTVQRLEPNSQGLCNTLTTVQKDNYVAEPQGNNLRIRKLTPKECFRLMGFDDTDFEKAEKVNSNTQLYKQAGNSIVVPVLEYIINALFDNGALEK